MTQTIRILAAFFWLASLAVAQESAICRIAAVSNPYITALPAEEIKEPSGKSRSFLKARSATNMEAAVKAVNHLKPDAWVILGNLTWTGSDADLAEAKKFVSQSQVQLFIIPGPRDLAGDGAARFEREFGKHGGKARYSADLNGALLLFASAAEPPDSNANRELVNWMANELSKLSKPRAVLLFGGPQQGYEASQKDSSLDVKRYWQMIYDHKIAARLLPAHEHSVGLEDALPTWTIPSAGWQTQWLLALITVYPTRLELSLLPALGQPTHTLSIPNPVAAPRMKSPADDPYGLITYTEDLALKPDLTFVQLADSQFDDASNSRVGERYKFAPQMSRAAIEEVNRLKAAFAFMTGDLVNKCTVAEWNTFNELYAKLTIPLYTLPGNHDRLADKSELEKLGDLRESAEKALAFAQNIASEGYTGPLALYSKFTANFAAKGKRYYSFEQKGCAFICLDTSAFAIDAEQLKWLKNELERTKDAKHLFVVGHHPLPGTFGSEVKPDAGGNELLALLKQYKATLYLAGHRHFYAYKVMEDVPHLVCDDLAWGEYVAYQIYHVFPDRVIACWKPLVRAAGSIPLYERVEFPNPRLKR